MDSEVEARIRGMFKTWDTGTTDTGKASSSKKGGKKPWQETQDDEARKIREEEAKFMKEFNARQAQSPVSPGTWHQIPANVDAQKNSRNVLQELLKDPSKAEGFLSGAVGGDSEEVRMMRATAFKIQGDEFFKARNYEDAYTKYLKAVKTLVGKDFRVPLPAVGGGGVKSDTYTKLSAWAKMDMMEHCTAVARCAKELKDFPEALMWLEEVFLVCRHHFYTSTEIYFDWWVYHIHQQKYYDTRVEALRLACEVFLDLGNTGAASHRIFTAQKLLGAAAPINNAALNRIMATNNCDPRKILANRHPDPALVPKLNVKCDALQVRGSWQKLRLQKPGGMVSRTGFASAFWNGKLYVLGGEKDGGVTAPHYRDFHCVDLNALDSWCRLPDYPEPLIDKCEGWHLGVYKDKAYMFTGRQQVDFFDLKTEKWGKMMTTIKNRAWPVKYQLCVDYAMQIVKGKMYIFAGEHRRDTPIGTNLLMALDIESRTWQVLSGTTEPKADYNVPGPRRYPSSWVDSTEERIWVMFGEADRPGASMMGLPHGATAGYGYDDLFSWGIAEKQWRRERLLGNVPSPRSEMACTFNPKLNKVIVFGGYSPDTPTVFPQTTKSYSYYGDTFIMDPTTLNWKQVLTRGFPTYRALSRLIADPVTGKTFLFGGYSTTDFVPSREQDYISRTYLDIWQLCVDEPGGYFEGIDLEEEKRTAAAGPWQRCFNCGCAGQWKKCGGTCKGRAYFCDAQCLKEGWKEHRKIHKCAKA